MVLLAKGQKDDAMALQMQKHWLFASSLLMEIMSLLLTAQLTEAEMTSAKVLEMGSSMVAVMMFPMAVQMA